MTIDWHTTPEDAGESNLFYREVGSDSWRDAEASQHEFPFSERVIYRVELTGLQPNTPYEFRCGEFERVYHFLTMPGNIEETSVVFATGGDVRHSKSRMDRMNRVVMDYEPHFFAHRSTSGC